MTKEETLESIKWNFKSNMRLIHSDPKDIEEFATRPNLLLGLIYIFLMGWGDALFTNGLTEELREFHDATKHVAGDGWLPDDSWKWWLDAGVLDGQSGTEEDCG